jgi:hypothetical protein
MKRLIGLSAVTLLIVGAVVATTYQTGEASDHDDGESDTDKSRNVNLTDHFVFVSTDPATPNDLTMIMYFNPRSLPGKQYFLATNARYEIHVSKIAAATDDPTNKDDFVFRFEAAAPDANGVQAITTTVFKDGAEVGKHTGATTSYANSIGNSALTTNTGTVGNIGLKYFIGARADAFHFDVVRFFQVRNWLAGRFFGGANGNGNAAAALAPNCKGQALLNGILNGSENDGDDVNLFNPPECAQDFTHNYNVLAIVLNVPIADLGGGSFFDTWTTISVAK